MFFRKTKSTEQSAPPTSRQEITAQLAELGAARRALAVQEHRLRQQRETLLGPLKRLLQGAAKGGLFEKYPELCGAMAEHLVDNADAYRVQLLPYCAQQCAAGIELNDLGRCELLHQFLAASFGGATFGGEPLDEILRALERVMRAARSTIP